MTNREVWVNSDEVLDYDTNLGVVRLIGGQVKLRNIRYIDKPPIYGVPVEPAEVPGAASVEPAVIQPETT
jgi:hypothetical protein